jgi:ketosteroid isomerase-like protein
MAQREFQSPADRRGQSGASYHGREDDVDEKETVDMLRDIAAGFDTHDVDRIIRHFAQDAIFEAPRGPDRWGKRFEGRDALASAFLARFQGIPDVRYRDTRHFVGGDRGVSEWTLTGTTRDGTRLDHHGCDLWTFRDGLVTKKDSFWKIRSVE